MTKKPAQLRQERNINKTFIHAGPAQDQMPLLTELNPFWLIEVIKISLLRSWLAAGIRLSLDNKRFEPANPNQTSVPSVAKFYGNIRI